MRNRKGFTLIELLAVIAIIALISMIAIPNIVGLSDGIRRDNMLDDAKKLISLAKYQVNINYDIRIKAVHRFTFNDLNINGDIKNDPDGGDYNKDESYVEYRNDGTKVSYCVVLKGSQRHIGSETECKKEDELYSKKNVVDN